MAQRAPRHSPLGLAVLVILTTAIATCLPAVRADPRVTDNGDGTRTAAWDFATPANYTMSNVAMGPGGLGLARTSHAWLQASDADFNANGTADSNVVIGNGSLSLVGHEGNLVADGDFGSPGGWTYTNGSAGTTSASWTAAMGELDHSTADNSSQFDSMDTGAGWVGVAEIGAMSVLNLESSTKHEGSNALRDTISLDNPAKWAGLTNSSAVWDFSPYNRLSVWLNTTYSGPGQLSVILHLESGIPKWDSPPMTLTNSWQLVEFDFTSFGGNLSTVNQIDLRFTGAVVSSEHVYVDDLWLLYRKSIDEAASIGQAFVKSWGTTGQPGSAILAWDYAATTVAIASLARFEVAVENSASSRQSWSIDLASSSGWTTLTMDLSTLMAPVDTYRLTFSLRVVLDTHLATAVTVRIDNVLLRAPNYTSGAYTSRVLDAGTPVVWGLLSWSDATSTQTSVTIETRAGSTFTAGDATWSPWQSHANRTGEPIGSNDDRYLQFRVNLWTFNSSRTPALLDLTIRYSKFVTAGYVESRRFVPPEPLVGWRRFDANRSLPSGTDLVFEVSTDPAGLFWSPVTPGGDLSGLAGSGIAVRAWLSTANTSLSPRIASMSVTYEFIGPLWTATLTPGSWSGTADDAVTFAAQGYDRYAHRVAFVPTWGTDDPTGSVVAGVYRPGTAGTHVVWVAAPSGVHLANATVTVGPGALARLVLSPPFVDRPAGSDVSFTMAGFDSEDNPAPLTATAWSATAGTFTSQSPGGATLQLPGTAGVVTVTARYGTLSASALVNVTTTGTPVISGTVPAQVHEEDSTWELDLTAYAQAQPDRYDSLANLTWYLRERDASLTTVWGEHYLGNHRLVFSGLPDATGTDDVVLWLEDATGARTSQPLAITLTPVNDPPHFADVPDLPVKAGAAYTFDVGPYLVDVDTPPGNLTLATGDPAHVAVAGLNLTLTYPPQDLGRTIYLRLSASDGEYSTQTVIVVTVTSNTPPHVVIPLPDLTLREDEVRPRAFPRSLSDYFGDDDGDDLFFSYGYRDVNVTIWDNGSFWQVDVRPNANWNGVERVTFRAEDTRGAFKEYTITVTVAAVNDPPTLSWRDDLFVRFDTPYTLDVRPYVSDVDDPAEDLVLEAAPARFGQVDGLVVTLLYPRFLLGPAPSYDLPLTLYLNDTEPGTVKSVYVHVSNNLPPLLRMPLPDVTFDEDTTLVAFRLDTYFADVDGPGALTFTTRGTDVKADIAADSTVTFRTAAANWFGLETVQVRAEDGARAFAVASVLVRVSPVNDAPRFVQQLPDRDMTGGGVAVIDLRPYVSDVDDDVSSLTFTATGAHAAVYGYILVLDVPADAPPETVRVNVTDGRLTGGSSFHIAVYQPTLWARIYWPWSGVAAVLAAIAALIVWELFLRFPHTLEDVFVIGREGRLILHNTRRLRADRDEDILAGMLTAIMLFVRDSFHEENEDLKQFEFGDRKVLVERGDHIYIAAIYAGTAPPWARKDLAAFVQNIEAGLGTRLANWSGDASDLSGLKEMTEEYVGTRRYSNGWTRSHRREA